jgi:hypothetical protein
VFLEEKAAGEVVPTGEARPPGEVAPSGRATRASGKATRGQDMSPWEVVLGQDEPPDQAALLGEVVPGRKVVRAGTASQGRSCGEDLGSALNPIGMGSGEFG